MGPHTTGPQPARSGVRWGAAGPADQAPPLNQSNGRGAQAFLELAVDGLKLADLQVQLLTVDVRQFWSAAWTSLLVLAAGTALLLAALPVSMIGSAEFLRQSLSISLELALLLVSGLVMGIALGAMVWSASRLSRALSPLRRSADELRENLIWMRGLLHEQESDTSANAGGS